MDESSLPGVLRERARTQPDEPAFTYVDYELDPAGVAETLTWARLYRQTSNVARELKACGSTGDRAVILAPQGIAYLLGFLGALQAGQIAVPLPLPMPGSGDERVSSVLLDALPATILTTSAVAGDIAQYIRPKPGGDAIAVVEVDLVDLDSETGAATDASGLPSTAHLQYTSGSTRTPAGVMVSHKNIQVNCEQLRAAYYEDGVAPPDSTVVSWLPFFHDMGLILNIAFPIFHGMRSVLTSPPAFLQRPARWMQLLASHPHAFSAGPNIAFELAAAKTSDQDLSGLDLGSVRNILNGAERVNPSTLRRFAERFARFNLRPEALRPSYGLAEGTLYVATRATGEPPQTQYFESERLTAGEAKRCAGGQGTALVSYGLPTSPMVRIVDPEARVECPEGTVGEIWTRGDNVCEGYWQKPEETERTFGAELVDPSDGTPGSPWLRTGDLGFFSAGELFIVGRIKDLLIVYGRNYAPDDIEATIQEITAGRVVAGAVPDDDGVEKLVTIVEFKAGGDPAEAAQRVTDVKRKIAAAVSRTHELGIADLVMVPPHSIPLTTSGKVRRRDSLKLYRGGEFTRLDELVRAPVPRAAEGIDVTPDAGWSQRLRTLRAEQQDILVGQVSTQVATVLENLTADEVDPDCPFRDMGFDSVKATELLDRLRTVTGLPLPPTLAFDHPTPNELAAHLGRVMAGSAAPTAPVGSSVDPGEPIAVVGMACRFPGGVDSPAALWDMVAGGTEVLGDFPTDRGWNLADLFDPDPDAVGKTYTRVGGFLPEAGDFDAEFFGISAREAQTMDPQQRVLLEVCWEALESARINPAGLARSRTGVFIGAWSQTYGAGGSDGAEGYGLTGTSSSVASGRISYALGLQGPAVTIDTACSSSLVATHLACQSLRNGESTLALAGGVTVMATPSVFTEFARQRGLAADGRCKAFSANADGTGWGEGAALLVLERLSDAERNNHPVLAVVKGSAINQDGASNGLTAPNGSAQQLVITEAAANAGVGLDQVDAVEAHGTGTSLGDPIEAGALIATYGANRAPEHPLWLGSIKSNIGHTQAAAGAAGIIKMIEALKHDCLPPTLHVDRPSPHVDWSAGTVRLLTSAVPWPHSDHPRTAAVSSFGISGTNAHVILQQPPAAETGAQPEQPADADADLGVRLWPVSARSSSALSAQADRLHRQLAADPDVGPSDVAYSLGATRAHHAHRAVITASTTTDLLAALDALRTGQPHPQVLGPHHLSHLRGKTIFVLPGQGAQYPGMGRDLYEHHRVFAATVDACDEALRPFTDWSVRDVLRQEPSAPALDRVEVIQPVLFTMMVAMAEVLAGYGIVPDAVIGHSQGEIAAAYIAGALSLPEAAKVVALRSRALSSLRGTGGMASVLLPADQVTPLLARWQHALSIAAVNGPSHTIVSGEAAALAEFTAACERDGVHIRSIAVDYASHSAQVEPTRQHLLAELSDLKPAASHTPLYSTVGEGVSADALNTTTMDADYWYRNLREPVRFHDRVLERLAAGVCTFVELSPHPVLAPAITDTLAQFDGASQSAVVITLHRDRPAQESLATALGQLHNHGHSPSWSALYPHAHTVELPTYAFQHRRYWLASAPSGDAGGFGLDRADHPLLGAVAELADQHQVMVTSRLSATTPPWLAGDQLLGTTMLSAAGIVEMMLRAGELSDCPVIDDLVMHTVVTLSDEMPTDIQIMVQPLDETGRRPFTVHGRAPGGEWTLHAGGALSPDQNSAPPPSTPTPNLTAVDQDRFYDRLAQRGHRYGGLFRSVQAMGTEQEAPDVIHAEVALPAGTDVGGYGIHPALLDAALQPLTFLVDSTGDAPLQIPNTFSGVALYATAATQLYVRLARTGEDTFQVHATDSAGAPVITIDALTVGGVDEPATTGDTRSASAPRPTRIRPRAAAASSRTLAADLAAQSPGQRLGTLTDMVTSTTAAVLAHPDPAALDADRPFKDLGMDSLTALQLRNSLNQRLAVTLPATLTLDHPTPAAVAKYLAHLLTTAASGTDPKAVERKDNTLAYLDQAAFVALRAVHQALIQVTWIYDRPIDVEGLRRFHRNLGQGLLGRRIERSPLPFARDHWVSASAADEDIDFATTARPRTDITTWADERVRLPIDPEWGPGWHLGVLPLDDGGTAVSLVVTHTMVDAIGFLQALQDAAEGRTLDLGYPPPRSRTLGRAVREDLRRTVKDLPDLGHAVASVVRRARRDRHELKSSPKAAPSRPAEGADPVVEVPALIAFVDLAEWDACAKRLGGTSNSLAAGITSRLAVRAGRVKDDGTVTLRFSVSVRTEGDSRGNALTAVDVTVDPAHATTNLSEMQTAITQGTLTAMEDPDNDWLAPLPLAPLTPLWAIRKLAGVAAGGSALPVTCSNVGELSASANRPDGTDADYAYLRNLEPDMKLSVLEAMGGQLYLASGRSPEKVFIRVSGWLPGRSNTQDDLREITAGTLAEFGLTAEFEY
ncbi:type I polyketide synthase [Mycolicibacterium sp. P1-5]|uniref:type I polyketide synthase n=1 Tax=Mycolicibacterium sp. P1-5 TaxID=2024617 RepID=UPI0011ECE71D|nr:type I polyketide synthase [Mycolicibacterium sp. P1-5]KAA0111818.1 acyltransferase domain-containing protein [Mycolicibacterium sp. P1-5]